MMLQVHLRNALLDRGYFLSKSSDLKEVENFISEVRSHETDKPLIRLGDAGDGGYILPDDLLGVEYCFSPGVSDNVSFESDLARRGIRSFLADYSNDAPPSRSEWFNFEKKFLGSTNDEK